MTGTHVHPIEVDGEIAGLAVRLRRGFAFYAADAALRGLEGRRFTRRRDVVRAVGNAHRRAQGRVLLGTVSAIALGLAAVPFGAGEAHAIDAPTQERIDALEKAIKAQQTQIEQQQQQIRDLKSGLQNQVADVRRAAGEAPKVTLNNGRPTLATSDGKFTVSLRSNIQFDYANYLQSDGGNFATSPRRGSVGDAAESVRARDLGSGTNFRRAQFGIEGKLFGDFDYAAIFEFGGTGVEDQGRITQAWLGYSGLKPVQFRVGALAPPTGLDDAFSGAATLFLERATPAELARAVAGGDARSSAGVQGSGERWFASGYFTGATANAAAAFDEQTAFVGRTTYVPYKDADTLVHVGVNGSYVFSPSQGDPSTAATTARSPVRFRDRPEIRVDGTRLIDTGNINAEDVAVVGAELGATWKAAYLAGEYFYYKVDRANIGTANLPSPDFQGWYVQAAYALTGETRSYAPASGGFGALRPANPFSLDGSGWGAFEIAARYSFADLNYREGSPGTALPSGGIRGGEQTAWTAGLNWYANNSVRVLLNYQWVAVDRLSPGGTAFDGGAAITTPLAGTQIGQNLQVFSIRTQFAF
jgi:phosphate-selective porin OprO/OprP